MRILLYPILLILLFSGCNEPTDGLFTRMPSGKSGITFKNTLKESDAFNVMKYGYFYNGGGVAIGDVNNDGLSDIYFTGNLVASHLYINEGQWKFKNMAAEAGIEAAGLWNTGVNMIDINDDGWLDIYICRSAAKDPDARRNLLFINKTSEEGKITFEEQGAAYGLNDQGYSTQSAFLDYDRDGDLDMYLLNHSVQEFANYTSYLRSLKGRSNDDYGDKLYRNDGGKFTDVSKEVGIKSNVLGFGLGVSIGDFNHDTWPDIYVSNDYNEEDYLYINDGNGAFSDQLTEHLDHASLFSMGSDAGDLNNDGMTDLVTLDMLPTNNYRIKLTSGADNFDKYQALLEQGFYRQSMRNMLHLSQGEAFAEVGQLAGVSNTDWSWSALIADYDLDGLQDLFVTNGYLRDYTNMDFLTYAVDMKTENPNMGSDEDIQELLEHMPKIDVPNQIFKNLDGVQFEDLSDEWGFTKVELSNGAAYGDLDNDGDLDLVVNNINDFAGIYRNKAIDRNLGHFLEVNLETAHGSPIGSKVALFVDGMQMQRELFVSRGFQSSVEPILHFGLGSSTFVDSIYVTWPNGMQEKFPATEVNKGLALEQGAGTTVSPRNLPKDPLFEEVDVASSFIHQEDDFNDFRHQSLLPKYYSRNGPPLATGDVNGDGFEDLLCGAAAGKEAAVLLGNSRGSFTHSQQPDLGSDASYEDVAMLLLDIDEDQHLDLLVASGGNLAPEGNQVYHLRAYLNNGSGRFNKSSTFPKVLCHASCLAAGDFDGDGDLDVFLGSQYKALQYPLAGKSYLLINEGRGSFTASDDFPFADRRTAAAQTGDIDGDGAVDLVIAGEWEQVEVWSMNAANWNLTCAGQGRGWYSGLHVANLDSDKQLEIVAGNWGLNSQLSASQEQPMMLYWGDFDQNSTIDPIMSTYSGDDSYPFVSRDDLLGQLPGLKKLFVTYHEYAEYTMNKLLESLPGPTREMTTHLATILLDLVGDSLRIVPLPLQAQVAPVYGIADIDFDDDEDQDLILVGNSIYNRVKIGEIDANHGVLLKNDGDLSFRAVSNQVSGLNLKGDVRSVVKVMVNEAPHIIFGVSNGPMKSYTSTRTLY